MFVGAHWRLFGPGGRGGRIRPAEAVGGPSRRGELELVVAGPAHRGAAARDVAGPAPSSTFGATNGLSRQLCGRVGSVESSILEAHHELFFHAPALLGSQRPLLRRTQPNQTAKALLLVLEGRCTRPISRLSLSSARSAASSNLGGVSRGFAVARSAVGVCQLAGDTSARGSSF